MAAALLRLAAAGAPGFYHQVQAPLSRGSRLRARDEERRRGADPQEVAIHYIISEAGRRPGTLKVQT